MCLKNKKTLCWAVAVSSVFLWMSGGIGAEPEFVSVKPLVPVVEEWNFNDYWIQRKIGDKDFYMAEQGIFYRLGSGVSWSTPFKQVGLFDRMIPGHFNCTVGKALNNFDPRVMKTLSPVEKELCESFLKNQWPLFSLQYCTHWGNPPPTQEALDVVGGLWIGDGSPEEPTYRLEPVFHYIKTGQKWTGPSMQTWKDEVAIDFFKNKLMPRFDTELPFYKDLGHQWTREEMRKLCDLYVEEYWKPIGRAIVWGGNCVSPYFLAANPQVVTVGEYYSDARTGAMTRGLMRQFGGNKFYLVWQGGGPTTRYAYNTATWGGFWADAGYPLPHVWYYIFRPFLSGANYYMHEVFPGACVQDIEGDNQHELSILGHIVKDMLDFADRHPERGVIYTPVALMMDCNRDIHSGGSASSDFKLPSPDDADQMNNGILNDLLFPAHRHNDGGIKAAPYGEIFDRLCPSLPGKPVDAKALENYKILFAMGGLEINEDFARALMDHVKNGGTLVVNAKDVGKNLPPDFLGLEMSPDTFEAAECLCAVCGKRIPEIGFARQGMKLRQGAEAVITTKDGEALVSRNRHGKGTVIVVGVPYMIQKEAVEITDGSTGKRLRKPLLNMVPHFFDHLRAGLMPVEVRVREDDRKDISWIVSKKGAGWQVVMFNYSLLREPGIIRLMSCQKVFDEYPYKDIPFQIVAHVPVEDVMELYQDRDVNWNIREGKAVISESMRGGDIRVYELQPKRIEMPSHSRYVNYALNKPVTASSALKGHPPEDAVDGDVNNFKFWQSDSDAKSHHFDMPQWLKVDLGEPKPIDHIFVLFHTYPDEPCRLRVYKYVVETSEDGENWTMALDESSNEDPADKYGLERWFEPRKAHHVKLTVQRSSTMTGAQVVEMKVMGQDKGTYQPRRNSCRPAWQARYPENIRDVAPEKTVYLMDLKPKSVRPGWMPPGAVWKDLNGPVTLYTDNSGQGGRYEKSLYGQSVFEAEYEIPEGSSLFVSAVGLGSRAQDASVVFKVHVDGVPRYESSLYRFGMPVLPVVVDVSNGKKLKLETTDGGDGITNDYAWWGEARLIKK